MPGATKIAVRRRTEPRRGNRRFNQQTLIICGFITDSVDMKDAARDDGRMNVDVWADVSCPFCYLGKRRFEAALERFPHKDRIEIVWHSFQLDPAMKGGAGEDLYGYVARIMGQSREWSVGYHDQIAAAARQAGLEYNFGAVVPCNTFDAHRLIHLAKKHGLGDKAEE